MASGLRALSVLMGVFLVFLGLDKTDWLMNDGILLAQLEQWLAEAPAVSRWYVETVAIPGTPVFSKLVVLGELAAGVALVLGYRVQMAGTLALLMILNFHFASGLIFTYGFLTNGYALPVIGGLLALATCGARLPLSVSLRGRT